MSLNELLKSVGQLSKEDFQVFYEKVLAIRSQNLPPSHDNKEQELLRKINTPFSKKQTIRFNYSIAKRDLHILSDIEYQELLNLNSSFEKYELIR